MLSADFSLGATGLVLHGFDADGGETLSISQWDTEYRFTLSSGGWSTPSGGTPEGVALDGQTLAIKTAVVDQLVEGLTIVGNRTSPLDVSLGQLDFGSLEGSLNFVGIRSIDQVANTEVALRSFSTMSIMAPSTGLTFGSLNVAGDLTILSYGPITDGPGTQINVTGDATFISLAFHPAGDFDGSGEVTADDYGVWTSNFGLSVGATKSQGDANGDGAVNAADYTAWRDTLGQVSQPGGIFLADNPTDQLTVGGQATFEAQDGTTRFDIELGSAGTTNFGSLGVIGANVFVQEDSSSLLVGVDAATFTLESAGSITDADGTTIEVAGLATFDAGANPITLGDHQEDMTNFVQLHLTGGAVAVTEDSGTELTGVMADTLTLNSNGPITDANGTTIAVASLAQFDAGSNPITLGDDAADMTNFGQLHLKGGMVTVTEDSDTQLTGVTAATLELTSAGAMTDAAATTIDVTGNATFNTGGAITLANHADDMLTVGDLATFRAGVVAPFFSIAIGPAGAANFGRLHLTGAAVSVQEDSDTVLTHVTATSLTLTSAGSITDENGTTIDVTGLATFNASGNPITLGNHATDITNFGQLHLTGGAVAVTEDSTTDLTGVSAVTLNLTSAGSITDVDGATLGVTGLATLHAGGNPITLGNHENGTTNFGQLHLTGGAIEIMEDSGTELTGVTAASLDLTSDGPITDAAGTTISVANLAKFNAGANSILLGDNVADMTNFGQLHLTGDMVTVTEDSSTELTGVSAATLQLTSAGAITDAAGTTIDVTDDAAFLAGGAITLANNAADVLTVGDLATFRAGTVAPFFNIVIGPAGDVNFGQLHLTGAAVSVQEDSGTELTHMTATNLSLTSTGPITDADGTTISVTGLATFHAGTNLITLGNHPTDGTNFGQLHLTGDMVTVTEDSSTELTSVSAATLQLTSAGAITDASGTTIIVGTAAAFHSGDAIMLADDATDRLTVGGLATFRAGASPTFFDITIGPAGVVNFGQLNLTGKVVTVQEDSPTELTGVVAAELNLQSDGEITDSASAIIVVTGPARFSANGKITLADMSSANSLIVHGLGSFVVTDGNDIDIGVIPATGQPAAANAQLDSLQFTAIGGLVRIALDGPIILSGSGSGGENEAGETELATTPDSNGNVSLNDLETGKLGVNSDAGIDDAPQSDVRVNGQATLEARTFVTLADQDNNNRFEVVQHASFISTTGDAIDLGVDPKVDPLDPMRGEAANAILNLGSFSFVSVEGDLTANFDNSVVLANASVAGSAWIHSAGSITDASDADTTITQFAILQAADGTDIVLGDGSAQFRMATATDPVAVFDASRFLAMKAENVSIEVDSGFNLSTSGEFHEFPGTVFLAAQGNISQVAHQGEIKPLQANRIAIMSAAAVLFSQVRVNGQVTTDDSTAPNLAIRGGTPVPVSVLPAGEFPVDLIPSSTITDFSPIGFNPGGVEASRSDDSGLIELTGARIMEPAAIGDGYSIIMKVLGDAKIGIVHDATGAQGNLVGIEVTDTLGNAYLQSIADNFGGAGEAKPEPEPTQSEAGNIVFTSMGARTPMGDPTSTIVQIKAGVFTAIAAGELTIDTDQPGEADAPGLRTTILTSDTGTVTSVEGYMTFDGRTLNAPVAKVGPRMIVDAPRKEQNAATTGLVFSPELEQRITLVAGSRGENNLILEMEWADVQMPRDGVPLPPGVDGTNPFADVAYVPQEVDGQPLQPFLQSSVPPLDFRVVTVRHEYAEEFIPSNPNLPELPTVIRLYNDPSINLFDQGGERNLNVAENFVRPRVITTTPGNTEPSAPSPPTVFTSVEPPLSMPVETVPQSRVVVDEIRVSATSGSEEIWYGRVGEDGEFIDGPGEVWPVEWDGSLEGDFLNEIRDEIESGTAPEGVYRIESKTPSAEQQLDEWVKGDAIEDDEQEAEESDAAAEEPAQPPQQDAETDAGEAAMTAPGNAAIDYKPHGQNDALASQLFVGASALIFTRTKSPFATKQSLSSDSQIDLSRAGRRRRAWSRLGLPDRRSTPRSEVVPT